MLTNTDRIVIAAGDLEKAQKDLVHVLGRSPSWVGGYPGDETASVLWKLDNICIELVAPVGETQTCKDLRERLDTSGGGVHAQSIAGSGCGSAIQSNLATVGADWQPADRARSEH